MLIIANNLINRLRLPMESPQLAGVKSEGLFLEKRLLLKKQG